MVWFQSILPIFGSTLVQVMACRLFGDKPLPKLMLTYCHLDPREQISVQFWTTYKTIFQSNALEHVVWRLFFPKIRYAKGYVFILTEYVLHRNCGAPWRASCARSTAGFRSSRRTSGSWTVTSRCTSTMAGQYCMASPPSSRLSGLFR